MEKLTASDFAGIEAGVFELKPLTVLIGPQATGKSVVAKLLYFFRGLPISILEATEQHLDWVQFGQNQERKFLKFFPPATWPKKAFKLQHTDGDHSVTVSRKGANGSITISLPESFRELYTRIQSHLPQLPDQSQEEGSDPRGRERVVWRNRSERELCQILGQHAGFQQIFVTAARAFFSQAKASVFTQLREGGELDPFLVEFGAFLEQTRNLLIRRGFFGDQRESTTPPRRRAPNVEQTGRKMSEVHRILADILRGKLVRDENGEAIQTADGRTIPISLASSGQQEALPLLLLLARFFLLSHRTGRALYIEEPEAHLFPSAQRHVIELLAEVYNRRRDEMQIVLTTHSPYILTSLNNLLKAGQRYAEGAAETSKALEKIVPETRSLRIADVAAISLDGEPHSIMDAESGLIDPVAIDSVSEILAEEFHRLLWEGR